MDRRTTGIVATIVAVLLCGCPGLAALCFGAMFAVASQVPGAEIDVFGSGDPQRALSFGIGSLCLGVVFIAIPIIVGFLTLRKQPETASSATIDVPAAAAPSYPSYPVQTPPQPVEPPKTAASPVEPPLEPPPAPPAPPPDEPIPPAI